MMISTHYDPVAERNRHWDELETVTVAPMRPQIYVVISGVEVPVLMSRAWLGFWRMAPVVWRKK